MLCCCVCAERAAPAAPRLRTTRLHHLQQREVRIIQTLKCLLKLCLRPKLEHNVVFGDFSASFDRISPHSQIHYAFSSASLPAFTNPHLMYSGSCFLTTHFRAFTGAGLCPTSLFVSKTDSFCVTASEETLANYQWQNTAVSSWWCVVVGLLLIEVIHFKLLVFLSMWILEHI